MDVKAILIKAMNEQGIHDNQLRAGIAAIVGGESNFIPRSETSYANTSVSRIRAIFGSRVRHLTDELINELKKDDIAFFNHVYGGSWGADNLGNTQPGDGYLFRGRGPNQLTGRYNYTKYGRLAHHPEILTDPDLVNDPEIGCAVAVAFLMDRYHGGGWEVLKRANGNPVDGDRSKNELYAQYLQSGEFDYEGEINDEIVDDIDLAYANFKLAAKKLQTHLMYKGLYNPPLVVDGIWGPGSQAALNKWLSEK